jgi:hypothetical protein
MGRYKEACSLIYKAIWAIAFVASTGDILEALFSAACLVDLGCLRAVVVVISIIIIIMMLLLLLYGDDE